MRKITWLVSEEETSVMDLTPVAAKAHKIRVQKAAFGGFTLPSAEGNTITEGSSSLKGRVKLGRVQPDEDSKLDAFTF